MLIVPESQSGLVNNIQVQRTTYLCNRDLFTIEKEVLIQKSARLKEFPSKNEKRSLSSVDLLLFCIACGRSRFPISLEGLLEAEEAVPYRSEEIIGVDEL